MNISRSHCLLVALFFLSLLFGCHPTNKAEVEAWFDDAAENCDKNGPLHHCSRYNYLSESEYEQMIMLGVNEMNPPLKHGESIFDLGMGVGAVFKVLDERFTNLKFGGSDLAKNALDVAISVFPEHAENFLMHDMTKKHRTIADNSQDHVISFGALGMYLTQKNMLKAFKEALRMTKPGQSMLFTHFIEPGKSKRGSIITPVEKDFLLEALSGLGMENIKFHSLKSIKNQGDRFMITATKKK